jgi:hypothetical protein
MATEPAPPSGIPHLFASGDFSGSAPTFMFSGLAGFHNVVTSIEFAAADSGIAVAYIHESTSTHAPWAVQLSNDPLTVQPYYTWSGYQVLTPGATYSASWFPGTQFGHLRVSGFIVSL